MSQGKGSASRVSRIFLLFTVAPVIAAMMAFPSPALAQPASADASSMDPCTAANAILNQLPAASTNTASAPASAIPATVIPTTYADTVILGRGIETSAGSLAGDTTVGATFIGELTGDLPGTLATSINYTPPFPGPGVTNNIVGGQWALCGAWGRVFGSFTNGTVQWNADGTLAGIVANLSVVGGSVNGMPVSGEAGTFNGTLSHLTFPPTVSGTLQLHASAAPATSGTLPNSGGPSLLLSTATLLLLGSGLLGLSILRRFL